MRWGGFGALAGQQVQDCTTIPAASQPYRTGLA